MKEFHNPHKSTCNDQIGRRKKKKKEGSSSASADPTVRPSYRLNNHMSHRGQRSEIMAKECTDASPVARRQTFGNTSDTSKGVRDRNVAHRTRRRDNTDAPEGLAVNDGVKGEGEKR